MSRDVTVVLKATDQYSTTLDNFNQKVSGIGTSTDQLTTTSKKTSDALGDFTNKITGMITAYAGWKGMEFVGQMLELGENTNKTTATFNALTTPLGSSQAIMMQLKDSTGGVVDNLTLMQGANKLLQMGLAGNSEELLKLSEMAVKLGSSMGMDATKAMSDFSLMLANNSVMRLDQFGIASARVRDKMEALKESFPDMDKSERFKLAVLDEGAKALARLGSAAEAAETPLARLQASAQNFGQSFSSRLTTGVNATIGMIEYATGSLPGQAENKAAAADLARNQAAEFARSYFDVMVNNLDMAGVQQGSDAFVSKLMFTTAEALKNNPNADVGKVISDAVMQGWQSGEVLSLDNMQGYIDSFTNAYQLANTEIEIRAENDQRKVKQELLNKFLAGDSGRDFSPPVDVYAQMYADVLAQADDKILSLQQQRAAQDLAAKVQAPLAAITGSLSGAFGQLGYNTEFFDPSLFQTKMDKGYLQGLVPQFMEQGDANQMLGQLRTAEDELQKLKDLADQKLVSDASVTNAENMVDNLRTMADQAQKAADNFKNLTLGGALGQGSGGMQGEMTDLVIKQMKAAGATDAQIAAMQAELDKSSGRETESSEELKQKIIPIISKMSAKEAAKALANLDAFLKEATLQGMTPEMVAAAMPSIVNTGADYTKGNNMANFMNMFSGNVIGGANTGMGGAGSIFDDEKQRNRKGSNLGDVAQNMTQINKDSAATDKSMKAIQDSTTAAAKASEAIKQAFDHLKTQHELKFKFTADDPSGILGIVKQILGGGSLAEIVRNNGGTVPGATSTQPGGGGDKW